MTQTKIKLLLVDDKENNLLALEKVLADLDIQILKAISGNDALRIATTQDIALILMDVKMPDMDGYEVAELLRYEEETQHIPIIFITGYHQEQHHVFKGYQAGAVDYLLKPINPYILKSKIAIFIELHRQKKQIIEQAKTIRHSQKMAMLGTLAAGIAHNFNNLLMPIVTFSEVSLKRLAPDHEAFTCMQQVTRSAQRAKDLVAQILLFARQDDTKMTPLSLFEVLQEVADLLQEMVGRSITIIQKSRQGIPHDLPLIIGNASKLHQVLMNLCINAADAMPEGGELSLTLDKITFKSWLTSQGQTLAGNYIRLSVQDTGCGMDETILAHSFEPFFSLKQAAGGTGLGLPMVLSIMEQHKGGIDVQSQLDQGTCFHLYFPALAVTNTISLNEDERRLNTEENKALSMPNTTTITLLLVEDEAAVRESLVFALEIESEHIKIIATENAKQALALVQQSTTAIDVMVTDQTMPEMTGLQLAKKVRAMGHTFPIILSTGYARFTEKQDVEHSGVNVIIQKPYHIAELLALITDLVEQSEKSL